MTRTPHDFTVPREINFGEDLLPRAALIPRYEARARSAHDFHSAFSISIRNIPIFAVDPSTSIRRRRRRHHQSHTAQPPNILQASRAQWQWHIAMRVMSPPHIAPIYIYICSYAPHDDAGWGCALCCLC